MNLEVLEIAGLRSTLKALRLPFGRDCRSFTHFKCISKGDYTSFLSSVEMNPNDLKLMSTLVKRGDEHAKAIRGIVVWMEIEAPVYWWEEECTYRVGTETLSSSSTMHTIGNGVTIDDFDVSEDVKECLTPTNFIPDIKPLYFETPEKLESKVLDFNGVKYEIWNNGDIYVLEREVVDHFDNGCERKRLFPRKKLKKSNSTTKGGYYQIGLGGRKGKTYMIHRVIATAFCSNPNNYPIVNHKDGNKWNCSPSNLEWCTSSHNNKHAINTGLRSSTMRSRYLAYLSSKKYSDSDIEYWKLLREEGRTLREISEITGASNNIICQYINNNRGKCSCSKHNIFYMAEYYEETIKKINELADEYKKTGDFKYVIDIKNILPNSFKYKRVRSYSYQSLRTIYKQRKDHRLPEWKQFLDAIECLPYAEELILCGLKE